MSLPLYAILLDGGFLTKKLYLKHNLHATVDDIVAECARLQSLPSVTNYDYSEYITMTLLRLQRLLVNLYQKRALTLHQLRDFVSANPFTINLC